MKNTYLNFWKLETNIVQIDMCKKSTKNNPGLDEPDKIKGE